MSGDTCTCGRKFFIAEDWRDHMPCPGNEVEQLRAENARLREALRALRPLDSATAPVDVVRRVVVDRALAPASEAKEPSDDLARLCIANTELGAKLVEARTDCIRAQEAHRAALEGLETYEARIREIADNVLGLQAPDVATIVLLDAIERECGRERIGRAEANAEIARLREALTACRDDGMLTVGTAHLVDAALAPTLDAEAPSVARGTEPEDGRDG